MIRISKLCISNFYYIPFNRKKSCSNFWICGKFHKSHASFWPVFIFLYFRDIYNNSMSHSYHLFLIHWTVECYWYLSSLAVIYMIWRDYQNCVTTILILILIVCIGVGGLCLFVCWFFFYYCLSPNLIQKMNLCNKQTIWHCRSEKENFIKFEIKWHIFLGKNNDNLVFVSCTEKPQRPQQPPLLIKLNDSRLNNLQIMFCNVGRINFYLVYNYYFQKSF